jgi:acetyltransferase
VLARAQDEGLGISKFVSYGNGADLTQVDFLDYLRDDPLTRVVALYIESVSDGRAFLRALTACAERKPVVVIKAGRTGAGARATASHTGSLAGSDAVYEAAIRQAGAIRARSVDELMDLCTAFSSLPPMRGKRLLIVTNSGGPGVLAADLAEELGLDVSEPCAASKAWLGEFVPGHASLKNPVDLTVEGTREGFRRALQGLLPGYDAALAMNVSTPYLDTLGLAEGVIDGSAESGKPVVANFLPTQPVGEAVTRLKAGGVPDYASGERAVAALAALARDFARRQDPERGMWAVLAAQKKPAEPKPLPGTGPLLEPQAMAWLAENGLAVPGFQVAETGEQAAQAAQILGFPVVMKVVSPEILHKSDVGGVMVGIRDEDGARQAFKRIRQAAEGRDFRGVVIYPMVAGGVEVLVGVSRDAQFGPVVAVGVGGIFTEVLRDVSLRVAPVDTGTALEMINELRGAGLLRGARGRPPCDLQALAHLVAQVSELPFAYPELKELDLNPVFALEQGVVIGDVRVIRT